MRIISMSIIFILSIVSFSSAQLSVVDWSIKKETLSEGMMTLTITADIDKGWKLYSQHTAEGGPIPTSFTFENLDGLELVGNVEESENVSTKFSDLFELDVTSFYDRATFTQKVKLNDTNASFDIKVRYMCCDGLKCIPPTVEEFSVEL